MVVLQRLKFVDSSGSGLADECGIPPAAVRNLSGIHVDEETRTLRLFLEDRRQSGLKSFCRFQIGRLLWTPESAVPRSTGLEPVTQGLEIPCSIQLSYERKSSGLKDGKVNLGSREVNRGRG
jgi:hypothetical protein